MTRFQPVRYNGLNPLRGHPTMKIVKSAKSPSRDALLADRVQSTGPATLAAHPAGAHPPLPPAKRVEVPGQSTARHRTGGAAKGAVIAFPAPPPPSGPLPAHIRSQACAAAGLAPVIPFPRPTPRAACTVDQTAAGHSGTAAPAPRNRRGADGTVAGSCPVGNATVGRERRIATTRPLPPQGPTVAPSFGAKVVRRGGRPGPRRHHRGGVTSGPATVRPVLRAHGVSPRALHPHRAPVVGNSLPRSAPRAGHAHGGNTPAALGSSPGICLPPAGLNARQWLEKCADHGNCLAFVPGCNNTPAVLKFVWARATACLMPFRCLHCDPVGGRHGGTAGTAGMLVAFGQGHAQRLAKCKLRGVFFRAVTHQPAPVWRVRSLQPKVPQPRVARHPR
jgi:hypothetical protein